MSPVPITPYHNPRKLPPVSPPGTFLPHQRCRARAATATRTVGMIHLTCLESMSTGKLPQRTEAVLPFKREHGKMDFLCPTTNSLGSEGGLDDRHLLLKFFRLIFGRITRTRCQRLFVDDRELCPFFPATHSLEQGLTIDAPQRS